MRILLAIDGSGHSEAAVDEVARRHLETDSEVRVISVLEPLYSPAVFPGGVENVTLYTEIEEAARTRAHVAVDKAAAILRATEARDRRTVTTDVLFGSAKHAILHEADAFGADLIVVGSHGHGHFERFLLGSVSHAVAIHATCSVEIVRRTTTQRRERTPQQ